MKVLQVNCVYKKGSTGKIVYDIHKSLQDMGIESVVCYGRGKKETEPKVYKTSNEYLAKFNNIKSRFTGLQYNGSFIATKNLIKIIEKESPDVVHLHCLNGFFVNIYKLLNYLKKNNIRTVLTLHAEFMYTGGCGHAFECERWLSGCGNCPRLKEATRSYFFDQTSIAWEKMKQCFSNFDNLIVVPVSPWVEKRAKKCQFFKHIEMQTILNGIDTNSIFYPRNIEYLKERHNLTNEVILLHVTASFDDPVKGGKYIIQLAEKFKNQNIKIILIGNKNPGLNIPENIIDVGVIKNQHELAAYYSLADLTILTSKRETYSMVCAESLSCGTPVIGFKAGAPEEISLKKYSSFVNYGMIDELYEEIQMWLKKGGLFSELGIETAKNKYSKEKMCKGYINLYESKLEI
ncbi:glycosyltransferase [Turicibacter sanguinis]|uniref:glycosyltransferase n=1 Tax=Turicibacter sanguinis TaxID=154288 RepID=UPI0012BD387D|nr:glycosyltransferase [Turicibacter sanguinis]MDB8545637.1 glycosyltransferase [Turicibacter sanguinis]MTO10809.1 glycosyltransferase [Turicibacter sanguinis]MTP48344.1 glycosyltransferase [Turicibacter sanguinis]MTP51063.1 glycosyltransferase [Turicibacter sanguinis]MTQ08345.1 glycosyltransferase [Turicibacter sanguinis]